MIRPKRFLFYFLLGSFLSLFFPLTPARAEDKADFELKRSSFVNRVRAYPLRVQSMEEMVSAYPHETFPLLISLFKDSRETPALRYLAAQKLEQIDEGKSVRLFREILENRKEDVFARRASLAELVRLNEKSVKEFIREIIDDKTEDPALRQYALAIYSEWDERGKLEKLRNFVRSKQEPLNMRANALFLLESLQDTEFVRSTVRQFLKDRNESEELRKNCIVMAERLKDSDSLTLLRQIAQDPGEPVLLRELSKATLSHLDQPDSVHART